ncbi:hypothetical protein EYF80_009917 [Liparis tanakae]|uniref:Uncharacterized protein n=1 Tax=Liparis tanakae TaxID=230148 RepID=A0A4Z2IPD6_9TELE|nr:hypothetical protein EYF80_009917 [Liparis tanakae]
MLGPARYFRLGNRKYFNLLSGSDYPTSYSASPRSQEADHLHRQLQTLKVVFQILSFHGEAVLLVSESQSSCSSQSQIESKSRDVQEKATTLMDETTTEKPNGLPQTERGHGRRRSIHRMVRCLVE